MAGVAGGHVNPGRLGVCWSSVDDDGDDGDGCGRGPAPTGSGRRYGSGGGGGSNRRIGRDRSWPSPGPRPNCQPVLSLSSEKESSLSVSPTSSSSTSLSGSAKQSSSFSSSVNVASCSSSSGERARLFRAGECPLTEGDGGGEGVCLDLRCDVEDFAVRGDFFVFGDLDLEQVKSAADEADVAADHQAFQSCCGWPRRPSSVRDGNEGRDGSAESGSEAICAIVCVVKVVDGDEVVLVSTSDCVGICVSSC